MHECPECDGELELFDCGKFKIYDRCEQWEHWKCKNCDYEWSDEPDYDLMKGGIDYK